MAIFLTGDIHGAKNISKLNIDNFPQQKELTRDDYVIILGDFGLIWGKEETGEEKWWLNWLEDKPFTTLFIDGNHENYDRLSTYPISVWNGGNVQFIRPHVIHLMRGQVFTLQGKTFFTMGGAASHDIQDGILEANDPRIKDWFKDPYKMFRINHVSWWKEEIPSVEELIEGIDNLSMYDNVDFLLSHTPSLSELILLFSKCGGVEAADNNILTKYLDEIMAIMDFKKHYCGHMHIDKQITHNCICLYNNIEQIV